MKTKLFFLSVFVLVFWCSLPKQFTGTAKYAYIDTQHFMSHNKFGQEVGMSSSHYEHYKLEVDKNIVEFSSGFLGYNLQENHVYTITTPWFSFWQPYQIETVNEKL